MRAVRARRVDDTDDMEALAEAVGVLRRFIAACAECGVQIKGGVMCSVCANK
jgi:recombinational DNA repair protein RecR